MGNQLKSSWYGIGIDIQKTITRCSFAFFPKQISLPKFYNKSSEMSEIWQNDTNAI